MKTLRQFLFTLPLTAAQTGKRPFDIIADKARELGIDLDAVLDADLPRIANMLPSDLTLTGGQYIPLRQFAEWTEDGEYAEDDDHGSLHTMEELIEDADLSVRTLEEMEAPLSRLDLGPRWGMEEAETSEWLDSNECAEAIRRGMKLGGE